MIIKFPENFTNELTAFKKKQEDKSKTKMTVAQEAEEKFKLDEMVTSWINSNQLSLSK